MATLVQTCTFCGLEAYRVHAVREMMFGTQEAFSYVECIACGSIRIATIPDDIGRYYPKNYHSLRRSENRLRNALVTASMYSATAHRIAGCFYRFDTVELRDLLRLRRGERILDVGCGGARLVLDLRRAGYDACGIDPYGLDSFCTMAKELGEVAGEWDVIMFNHSFEHIPTQRDTLATARARLATGGSIVVRVPIANEAWKLYGTDWVQLDAPRHLCIHSERSFRMCASQAGLTVLDVVYDSNGFQFWGSELFRRGIPLEDGRCRLREFFTDKQLREYDRRAQELNREGRGDQACFFLQATAVI